jgi:chloride channel protein, CIC family
MSETSHLRDFTLDGRVLILSAMAVVIGACGAGLAVMLLKLIGLMTNLFYFHRFAFGMVSPAGSPFGKMIVFVPIVGGLIVGLMARYGSDKIRGHGIPEAMEAILLNGAKVQPRLAVLKPISAAIAIGSGGPFGAEGPIIMTGGAVGSLLAQGLHLSDNERTVLLVAGAAAGMSATFAAPFAAVLLAVELLLFEWRPRSLIPVAVASVTAGLLRILLMGAGPVFPSPTLNFSWDGWHTGIALVLGLLVGLAAALLSRMVYGCEDLFEHLPLHWAWWPALGGLGVGIGGLIFPHALGVGYDMIALLLTGHAALGILLGVLLVKSSIWVFALGSGTSGGVLAPLLMVGGAMGAMFARLLHSGPEETAVWALIGMGSMLAGSLGAPLTAIVFSLELTHQFECLPLLVVGCIAAYGLTAFIMPRSILTEKLGRRGLHLSREYGIDPLEMLMVSSVMRPEPPASDTYSIYSDEPCRIAAERMARKEVMELAVRDRATRKLMGSVALKDLLQGRKLAFNREENRTRVLGLGLLRRAERADEDAEDAVGTGSKTSLAE